MAKFLDAASLNSGLLEDNVFQSKISLYVFIPTPKFSSKTVK
jgi:hypothetical protein